MASHLLNLDALHAAAPGILTVIFGSDGPASFWSCPVRGRIAIGADLFMPEDWYWVAMVLGGGRVLTTDHAPYVKEGGSVILDAQLDCRVPSVAARLLGLCARAMDSAATGAAWIEDHGDSLALRYCVKRVVPHDAIYWKRATGAPYATAADAKPVVMADVPTDEASFVAALVTALAPRIAALGGAR